MSRLLVVLLAALPLHADALSDIRTALGRLGATTPIRATFELQRNEADEGKFSNAKFNGRAAVDIEADGGAFRLVVPRTLLDQIALELDARPRIPTPSPRPSAPSTRSARSWPPRRSTARRRSCG